MSRPRVAVCIGGDCQKRPERADLEHALRRLADISPVRCLGVCHSPVAVVLDRHGDHVVIERIRTAKQRRDLVALITRGDGPSKRLAKRVVTGSRRRKALTRLAKRLAR